MSNGFCDSRINRAVIRLYALHPKEQKEEIIVNILALVSKKTCFSRLDACQRRATGVSPAVPSQQPNTVFSTPSKHEAIFAHYLSYRA